MKHVGTRTDPKDIVSQEQLAGLRNKIINGKMEIAQRGTSFISPTSNTYNLDRWVIGIAGSGDVTVSQQTDAPSSEFQSSLRVTVTTSGVSADSLFLTQRIEGYNARDLIGRTFTLSFWVRSSKTGVHCVAFRNGGADRSYVLEYSIASANTWEKKTVTVNGGLITSGSWNWTTGTGVQVFFAAAVGATLQTTTAGAWQTGNFQGTPNQVNGLDAVGNIFAITGVQLEVGSVATPFEHRPYGMELTLCQRYYYRAKASAVGDNFGIGYNGATTGANYMLWFPTVMRTAPTALEQSGTATDYSVLHGSGTITTASTVPTFAVATDYAARVIFTVASGLTAGGGSAARASTTNAYLGFSAEL